MIPCLKREILDDPTNYNEILVKCNEVSYKLRLVIQRPKFEEHGCNWEAPRKVDTRKEWVHEYSIFSLNIERIPHQY